MKKHILAVSSIVFALSLSAGALAGTDKMNSASERESGTVPPAQGTSSMPAAMGDEGAGTMANRADFQELDQNRDGEISEDELNAHGATAAGQSPVPPASQDSEQMMREYDRDNSGTLSKEEWQKQGKHSN